MEGVGNEKYRSEDVSPAGSQLPEYGDTLDHNRSWSTRFVDSFKRDPNAHATPKGAVGADGKVFDVENAAAATADSPLARRLKGRHLQMIAIGGSIGTRLLRSPFTDNYANSPSRYWSLRRFR